MKILTKKEQKAILMRIAANHIMAKKIGIIPFSIVT